jgi:hypothetical protein
MNEKIMENIEIKQIKDLVSTDIYRMLIIIHYIDMLKYELSHIKKGNVAPDVYLKARELSNNCHGFIQRLKSREPNFAKLFSEIDQEKIFAMMTINSNMVSMELEELQKLEQMFEIK